MKLKEVYLNLIKEGKQYNVSEIDIRYLLTYFYKIDSNTSFFLSLDKEVNENKELIDAFKELCNDKPLSYIIKETEFLGEKYVVNESTLIPRVETEELVAMAIQRINLAFKDKKDLNIIDIGTGSGVIAINLKKEFKEARVSATDISDKALDVARINAKKHNVNITFYNVDTMPRTLETYDIIISNPPYIKNKEDIDKSVLDYEPVEALMISDKNNVYEKIFKSNKFNKPCLMMFEISPDLEEDLKALINKHLTNRNMSFIFSKDINKKTRFLSILLN